MSFDIYLDEACQNGHHYMVIGGALSWTSKVGDHASAIRRIQGTATTPIKWNNLSDLKLSKYKEFVDHAFELINSKQVHVHVLVVDCSKLDHKAFSDGDKEAGFSKFMGQLLIHKFCQRYPAPLYIYPDRRKTKDDPEEVGKIINATLASRYRVKSQPIKKMRFRTYKETPMLWIPDLIIGAIGYQKNGKHLSPDAAEHKIELAEYIRTRAKCRKDWPNKGWGKPPFSVWNFDFSKSGKRGPGA